MKHPAWEVREYPVCPQFERVRSGKRSRVGSSSNIHCYPGCLRLAALVSPGRAGWLSVMRKSGPVSSSPHVRFMNDRGQVVFFPETGIGNLNQGQWIRNQVGEKHLPEELRRESPITVHQRRFNDLGAGCSLRMASHASTSQPASKAPSSGV